MEADACRWLFIDMAVQGYGWIRKFRDVEK